MSWIPQERSFRDHDDDRLQRDRTRSTAARDRRVRTGFRPDHRITQMVVAGHGFDVHGYVYVATRKDKRRRWHQKVVDRARNEHRVDVFTDDQRELLHLFYGSSTDYYNRTGDGTWREVYCTDADGRDLDQGGVPADADCDEHSHVECPMSIAAIARYLGTSPRAVRQRLQRAENRAYQVLGLDPPYPR